MRIVYWLVSLPPDADVLGWKMYPCELLHAGNAMTTLSTPSTFGMPNVDALPNDVLLCVVPLYAIAVPTVASRLLFVKFHCPVIVGIAPARAAEAMTRADRYNCLILILIPYRLFGMNHSDMRYCKRY